MEVWMPPLEEEEEEEEESAQIEDIRLEVVEFLLRRYGRLAPADIAKILGWKTKEVKEFLVRLEHWGRAERIKLGRKQVWTYRETPTLMYY
jgi:DNA-directed RNA polymerase specialized sigma24 family protein